MRAASREPSMPMGYMSFEGGEVCGVGGVPRTAALFFECGETDLLSVVTEPATCEYQACFSLTRAISPICQSPFFPYLTLKFFF